MITRQRNLVLTMVNTPRIRGFADYTEMLLETGASNTMTKLLTKVDKWLALQDTGTYEYQTGIIMKAAALRLKSSFETAMIGRVQVLRQALELVEPYAETPEGFTLFMNLKITLFECDPDRTSDRSKKMLDETYEIMTRFLSTCTEPIWEFYSLFSGKPPTVEVSEYEKQYILDNFKYCLYLCYDSANNEVRALECAIPSLRYSMKLMNPSIAYTCLLSMVDIVKHILIAGWFKQLDQCPNGKLSVKFKRKLPFSSSPGDA